ncbi:FecR family protein [Flavobacterium sp. TAB 87]|uniref:FecR family protein n=1 Tax=Flavobacterium sp. TAB 87 TaxID=1729581 RepID=UPI001E38DA86|nr:FecR family protein [Flavobacterium sp. TAB 87]
MAVNIMEQLFIKFITNQATSHEIDALTEWLEANTANQKVFNDFVKINYTVDYALHTFDLDAAKKKLLQTIKQERSMFFKSRVQSYLKYAAVLLVFISAFYLYQKNGGLVADDPVLLNEKEQLITLQSDNGSIQVINPDNIKNVTDKSGKIIGKQDKNKIVYSGEIDEQHLLYNTINVPNGKRFELILSDGTNVHLNSGTSLRYPVRFIKGENRQVFLDGEAFFDVTKDPRHPFLVSSADMNVKVLGTKFNVTSYVKDAKTSAVLVEGKVAASDHLNKEEVILKPGNRAYFGDKQLSVEPVDVRKYVAWVSGELMFIDDSFGVITNKLERKFNVDIVNKYVELNNIVVTATFKGENIEQVLKTFQTYKDFNYTIKNKLVTITKP